MVLSFSTSVRAWVCEVGQDVILTALKKRGAVMADNITIGSIKEAVTEAVQT
jgi:hypothetical protein